MRVDELKGAVVIVQATNEVVVHHHDLDLLFSLAYKAEEMEENRRGAVVKELSGPLDNMIVSSFESEEAADKFVLLASHDAMEAGEYVVLDPHGFEGEDKVARKALQRQVAAALSMN